MRMLLLIISTLLHVTFVGALECYQCSNVNQTANCHNLVVCQAHEKCFTTSSGAGDQTLYTLGCKHEDICVGGTTASPVSIVGRFLTTNVICSQCCSIDTCNKKLCSANNPIINEVGHCKDDPSFDCERVSSLFDVCVNVQHAKTVCRKFCGLCNVVDGAWSFWSSWGSCDVTCDSGHVTRTRACTDPAPKHGGLDCIGNSSELQSCVLNACPVDGAWSLWSPWNSCSVTCGVGLQRRDRSCSNPYPDRNGNHCFGDARDDRTCFEKACQDGHWSVWSNWSGCSATCSFGLKTRTRYCNNPQPSQFGSPCTGNDQEQGLCNTRSCPTQHVAFSVTTPDPHRPGIFLNVSTNLGGGYNTTTGKFVCPVAGLYLLSVHMRVADVSTDYTYCTITHNGRSIAAARTDNDAWDSAAASVYEPLSIGDTVYLKCVNWEKLEQAYTTTFNGALIQHN